MQYRDNRNNIVWTEEMFAEAERLWDYFVSVNVSPMFNPPYNFNRNGLNAIGWLVFNGYTVETFTVEYAGMPTEWVLSLILP